MQLYYIKIWHNCLLLSLLNCFSGNKLLTEISKVVPTSVPGALLKLGATSTMLPRFLTSVRIFNAPVSFVQFAISSIVFSQTSSGVKSSFCGPFCSQCIFGFPVNCVWLTTEALSLKSSLPLYYTALITLVANREYTPLPSAECHSLQLPYPFVHRHDLMSSQVFIINLSPCITKAEFIFTALGILNVSQTKLNYVESLNIKTTSFYSLRVFEQASLKSGGNLSDSHFYNL